MEIFFIVVSILVVIGMHWLMFRAFFSGWDEYWRSDCYSESNWFNSLDEEHVNARWRSLKRWIYHLFCFGVGFYVFYLLCRFFG